MLFSGSWDEFHMNFDCYHTRAGVSDWWRTHPNDWTYMGLAVWDEVQGNWRPPHVWGWNGYRMRMGWGQRARASRM